MNLSWSWKLNDHFCMALGQDKQRATTFQQLHNLQELSQCLYRTTLYIYSLPVYGFKSSSSLRANSGIFNIDSATAISLYIPPLSDIAYWVGFSNLILGKFYCSLLHPFMSWCMQNTVTASHTYLWGLPSISTSVAATSGCPSKDSWYYLPAAALSHHHFSCVTDGKLGSDGCWALFCKHSQF